MHRQAKGHDGNGKWRGWRTAGLFAILTVRRERPAPAKPANGQTRKREIRLTESLPPIELTPPDIGAYRHGNTGIDHGTTLESGRPGPHAVIVSLIHGNEIGGAVAMDRLFRMGIKPSRGRLTLVFANTAAYQSFDAERPYASRFVDEDMNRVWSRDVLDGPRDSAELRRARQLRPVFDAADVILDLHSMTVDTPPLTLCGRTDRARALARRLGYPAWIVSDEGHAAGRRVIDYADFAKPDGAEPDGRRTAILVECGQHWRAETALVALESCMRFLLAQEMVDPSLADRHIRPHPDPQRTVEVTEAVTAETDDFFFDQPYVGMEVIPAAGTVLGRDGARRIVTPYDDCVLIMPARRPKSGQTAVRLGRIVS